MTNAITNMFMYFPFKCLCNACFSWLYINPRKKCEQVEIIICQNVVKLEIIGQVCTATITRLKSQCVRCQVRFLIPTE